MKVTGNRGVYMPSWLVSHVYLSCRCGVGLFFRFDCYSFDIPNREEDEAGLLKAASWINDLITLEGKDSNIPPERIVIGGISQGGAVGLLAGLTSQRQLAGIFALSTYIPLRGKISQVCRFNRHLDFRIWNIFKDVFSPGFVNSYLLGTWRCGQTGGLFFFERMCWKTGVWAGRPVHFRHGSFGRRNPTR